MKVYHKFRGDVNESGKGTTKNTEKNFKIYLQKDAKWSIISKVFNYYVKEG